MFYSDTFLSFVVIFNTKLFCSCYFIRNSPLKVKSNVMYEIYLVSRTVPRENTINYSHKIVTSENQVFILLQAYRFCYYWMVSFVVSDANPRSRLPKKISRHKASEEKYPLSEPFVTGTGSQFIEKRNDG